ncbi:hypothetical protein D9615_009414 [Tricholomella constricta]|uniref:DUS-like FMN-binding domain-containing protein n=1 Tax=Tricholomella constricta TaxID=117010 RepID=A0A8H5M017_9AGAR|nr:hypothetical protein D9615_009414 [Tricholomella constricta]
MPRCSQAPNTNTTASNTSTLPQQKKAPSPSLSVLFRFRPAPHSPVLCQLAPERLLPAAKLVEAHCDAINVNLGWPQEIARHVNALNKVLSVPVTAKFHIFPEGKLAYAQMHERVGARIHTYHEQGGKKSGLASYANISAVKAAVRIPFVNCNIPFSSDIARCLAETGTDAVMPTEGVLDDAALFHGLPSSSPPFFSFSGHPSSHTALDAYRTPTHPPCARAAHALGSSRAPEA